MKAAINHIIANSVSAFAIGATVCWLLAGSSAMADERHGDDSGQYRGNSRVERVAPVNHEQSHGYVQGRVVQKWETNYRDRDHDRDHDNISDRDRVRDREREHCRDRDRDQDNRRDHDDHR